MKMGSFGLAVLGWLLFNGCAHAQGASTPATKTQSGLTPVDAFVKQDSFNDVRLSPTGEFYAVSVPLEDKTLLVVLRRADLKQTGIFNMRGKMHAADFWWVNDDTIVIALGEKMGGLDQPVITGELVSMKADGTGQRMIYGYRMEGDKLGSNIKGRSQEYATAFLVDDLPGDDDNILIGVWPWLNPNSEPYTQIEKLSTKSGRRVQVARAPIRRAQFVTDPQGQVRFAIGANADNDRKTYYRANDDAEWELIGAEVADGFATVPLGFSGDGRIAYLQVEQPSGPDGIVAFDPQTRKKTPLLRDDTVDPQQLIWAEAPREPIGAIFMDGKPRLEFFDRAKPISKLNLALQKSFNGEFAVIDSMTRDGKLALVRTVSDRSPGDYYLFDLQAKKADHVLTRRAAIDPARMGERRPIELTARDGMKLYGYLTVPAGSNGRKLPMVVHPHGGPIGVADGWTFDRDAQLMASRGYVVLQVNFRGSGNYGRQYIQAGFKQWGGRMQDDLTDATRWVIDQGIADPGRICIYGASYGAYASLMGAAKEPDLYRCAAGYVGVYDLPMMYGRGDVARRQSGVRFLEEALGKQDLASISPTRLANRIKVPVFLAAGGEDERAPEEHTRTMERALKAAGVPVETLVYPQEGHGFYLEAHNREFYTRLLAFLDRHIGPGMK